MYCKGFILLKKKTIIIGQDGTHHPKESRYTVIGLLIEGSLSFDMEKERERGFR